MKNSYSLLVLGSSNVFYSEGGPSLALPALVRDALAARRPEVEWRYEVRELYQSDSMARRPRRRADS